MASPRLRLAPRTRPFSTQQPHSTMDMTEESAADNDEPPDELLMATPKAYKSSTPFERRPTRSSISQSSLLTQMIHTPDSESQEEDENMFSDEISRRAHSSASTWSHGSFSTNELLSDGCQSPAAPGASPSLHPTTLQGALPTFNFKSFNAPATPRTTSSESIGPLQVANAPKDQTFEAGVGRKRCIQFACGGRKEESKPQQTEKQEPKPAEPAKRACMLKFVCPTRQESAPAPAPVEAPKRQCALTFACPTKAAEVQHAPKPRLMSPPPSHKSLSVSPRVGSRAHRGSDATVRNDSSPKTVRKVPSGLRHRRRTSVDTEIDRSEATRFHEFASSDEEVDDWTQEATCHRNRLTVSDTLKIENNLRKACTEVAEEEEEEDDVDNASTYDDEEEDDDEDDHEDSDVDSAGYSSDEGFASDDEEGFACSDEESDGGSDFEWWAPGRRASMSEPLEHIRPTQRRTSSASSIESIENGQGIDIPSRKQQRRARRDGRPQTPELPDSTDFVCGTLDEDRPAEQAYLQHLEKLRLAGRRPVPQDIDPSFPESDPEMDEEDEDSEHVVSESEQHAFLHGSMDEHHDSDSRPRSPRRLRSPAPIKRAVHRSPPPRRLFGQSPTRRCRSPPPAARLRSPPPTRRSSVKQPKQIPNGLAFRPRLIRQTSSLPRSGIESARQSVHSFYHDEDDEDDDQTGTYLPTRTAIDIVKGLEKKRQRRREKLYEKHCRNKSKRPEKTILPGTGCQRMRDVGLELNNYRGKKQPVVLPPGEIIPGITQNKSDDIHILSV